MTTGAEIVAPFRDAMTHNGIGDDIAAAIDKALARKDEAIESALGAMRIADAERVKAVHLAAERLEGLLAAAAFSTTLANQLRLEQ